MAAGRNFFILFPFLFTTAAFILTVVVIVGSIANNSILSKLYFMRLNVQHMAVTVNGKSYAASSYFSDFPDFYQVGLWNYCQGTITDGVYTVTSCTKNNGLFYFDPASVIKSTIGFAVDMPTEVTNALKTAKIVSYVMAIVYCFGAGFAVLEYIAGFFSFHSRGGSICSAIIAFFSSACIIVASALATGLYSVESKAFNKSTATLNVTASMNKTSYILTWVAAVCAVASAVLWLISICVGSTKSRKLQAIDIGDTQALMRQI